MGVMLIGFFGSVCSFRLNRIVCFFLCCIVWCVMCVLRVFCLVGDWRDFLIVVMMGKVVLVSVVFCLFLVFVSVSVCFVVLVIVLIMV